MLPANPYPTAPTAAHLLGEQTPLTKLCELRQDLIGNHQSKLHLMGSPDLALLLAVLVNPPAELQFEAITAICYILNTLVSHYVFLHHQAVDRHVILQDEATANTLSHFWTSIRDHNLVAVLLKTGMVHTALLEPNFSTVLLVLRFKRSSALDVPPELVEPMLQIVHTVLAARAPSPRLALHTLSLVTYLDNDSPDQQLVLFPTLLRWLCEETRPVFLTLKTQYSVAYQNSFLVTGNIPEYLPLPRNRELLCRLLAATAHFLAGTAHLPGPIATRLHALPLPLLFSVFALLRHADMALRLGACHFIVVYANHLGEVTPSPTAETAEVITQTHKKLVAALVDCLEEYYVKDPRMDHPPLALLNALERLGAAYPVSWAKDGVISKVGVVMLAAFAVIEGTPKAPAFSRSDAFVHLGHCFQLLGTLCVASEECRVHTSRLGGDGAASNQRSLRYILKYVLTLHDQQSREGLGEVGQTAELALSAAGLLKALSRSVALLRTFFVELDVCGVVVDLLQQNLGRPWPGRPHTLEAGAPVLSSRAAKTDAMLTTVLLGLVSNSVLEYSSIRATFIGRDIFTLLNLFVHRAMETSSLEEEWRELIQAYKLNALSAIRSLLYNESASSVIEISPIHIGGRRGPRESFATKMNLHTIFQLCEEAVPIQEQAFGILRNLSSSSLHFATRISQSYRAYAHEAFLNFCARRLQEHLPVMLEEDSAASVLSLVVLAVIYVLVHFANSSDQVKNSMVSNERLMAVLGRVLAQGCAEARLAVVWVVTNLTWNENPTIAPETVLHQELFDDEEGTDEQEGSGRYHDVLSGTLRTRCRTLVGYGFDSAMEAMTKAAHNTSLDLSERSKVALNQLRRGV